MHRSFPELDAVAQAVVWVIEDDRWGGLRRPGAPRPLLTGQLADRTPGTGVVDQGLALGGRGHERRGGGVVNARGRPLA